MYGNERRDGMRLAGARKASKGEETRVKEPAELRARVRVGDA